MSKNLFHVKTSREQMARRRANASWDDVAKAWKAQRWTMEDALFLNLQDVLIDGTCDLSHLTNQTAGRGIKVRSCPSGGLARD